MAETFSPQGLTGAKKIKRKSQLTNIAVSRWALPLILAFQALFAWILLQNTAFQDEALYIYAGRQIWQFWLGGLPLTTNYSSFFSGYPYVFPIIAGLLDMLGGLELVRLFSTICLLIVTACGYYTTKKLFNQTSAIFAALFFVCQGPVLFLTRLATYDPLCLCLLAVGMALAVNASLAERPWRTLGIGPILVLAFGTKYAALLFILSILALLAICSLIRWGWISMLVRTMLALLSLAIVGTLAVLVVLHFDPSVLHGIRFTTTNRVVTQESSRLSLAKVVLTMVGLSYVLALVSLVFARKKHLLIALTFLGSSLLVPAYHIYKAESVSLEKHLGFSMFFVMPLAGLALASLSGFRTKFLPGRHWLAGVAICLILFQIGAGEARNLYSEWPSSTNLTYTFQTQVRAGTGHYLVEQVEVLSYYLENDTYTWQWIGPYFFTYTDKQGHYYQGDPAYVKAINDGYFDLIELNFGASVDLDHLLAQTIKLSKKYTLIAKIPQSDSYGSGYFWIWRKI